jgi:hypothetical protein
MPREYLINKLRRWSHAVDAEPASDLMEEAAAELARLHTVIDSYAASAAAACREINMLRGIKDDAAAKPANLGSNAAG